MWSLFLGLITILTIAPAFSAIAKSEVYRAEPKKTQVYIHEGVIEGGESTVQNAFVSNIRRSKNADYERVVLDLDAKQIPSFHISVEPDLKRVVVTISGNARTSFEATKVVEAFKKSRLIEKVELFPKIEEQSWTFNLKLKKDVPVEAFTLSAPNRIVVDLKIINAAVIEKIGKASEVPSVDQKADLAEEEDPHP
jgi:hypothetical protein